MRVASKVGGVFSMIGGIAHHIAGMLGFHSPPPEGPAHDADKWMPNMMAMFTAGIIAGGTILTARAGGSYRSTSSRARYHRRHNRHPGPCGWPTTHCRCWQQWPNPH